VNEPATRATVQSEVERYAQRALGNSEDFVPGQTHVPVSGRTLAPQDFVALVEACLDGWLTAGPRTETFERQIAQRLGVRSGLMVNSGSSANLVAVSALTSPLLGSRRLRPGDEVITPALGFPTTLNPIIQNGLQPVLVDVDLGTYAMKVQEVRDAIGPKTRAIIAAHTLGNPFEADVIRDICRERDMWLIEDNCDALGSTLHGRPTGSFGDMSTLSFYPAHHITTGEGGMVAFNSPKLRRPLESFRDWGRACYCPPGEDDTCGRRFDWQLGGLPAGYDHKYIYSHIGYNLKSTDIQASLGSSQLQRLDFFGEMRKRNFRYYMDGLEDRPELLLPRATEGSDPSWFGFPILVRPESGIKRRDLIQFLDERNIGTRLLFGGDLRRQPAYADVEFRLASDLGGADQAMKHGFWIGTFPGLTDEMKAFVVETILEFLESPPS
jgi:CDP-6-deoxy-D-xylo-4-hexulose-3-dehydrase